MHLIYLRIFLKEKLRFRDESLAYLATPRTAFAMSGLGMVTFHMRAPTAYRYSQPSLGLDLQYTNAGVGGTFPILNISMSSLMNPYRISKAHPMYHVKGHVLLTGKCIRKYLLKSLAVLAASDYYRVVCANYQHQASTRS